MCEKISLVQVNGDAWQVKNDGPTRQSAIRRELATLWVAETLRNIVIIGLSRDEISEVVRATLDRWCGKSTQLDEPQR